MLKWHLRKNFFHHANRVCKLCCIRDIQDTGKFLEKNFGYRVFKIPCSLFWCNKRLDEFLHFLQLKFHSYSPKKSHFDSYCSNSKTFSQWSPLLQLLSCYFFWVWARGLKVTKICNYTCQSDRLNVKREREITGSYVFDDNKLLQMNQHYQSYNSGSH